jgi:hypothetical protein
MSNSIGNLKNSGLQGNNFPWQLKMLQGLQAIYDATSAPLTCVDQVTVCGTSFTDIGGESALNVNVLGGVTLTVDLDPADDAVGIYGYTDITDPSTFTALSVDGNGYVNTNATIVGPISQQSISTSVSVALANEQANIQIIPTVIDVTGATGNLTAYAGSQLLSISFASRGTAPVDLSVDGNVTLFRLLPGETLNMDANGVMNYYDPTLFYWDASAAGASVLIAFNYI